MDVWLPVGLAVGTSLLGAVVGAWVGYLFFTRQSKKRSSSERASLVQALLLEVMRNHGALAPTRGLKAPPEHMEDSVWKDGRMKLGEFLPPELIVKLEFVYSNLNRVREAFQLAAQVRTLALMQQGRSRVLDEELEVMGSPTLGEELGDEFQSGLEELDEFEAMMLEEARKGGLREREEMEGYRQKAVDALNWAAGWEAQLKECFDALRELDEAKAMREWADALEHPQGTANLESSE